MATTTKKTTKSESKTKSLNGEAVDVKPEVTAELPVETPPPEPAPAAPKEVTAAEPVKEPAPEAKPPEVAGPEPLPVRRVNGPVGQFGVPSEEPLWVRGEPGIRLKNLRNKPVDITLEHAVYCAAIKRCVCAERDVIRERRIERGSSEQAPDVKRIKVAKAIILQPMGTSEPLHAAAKQCADVKPKLSNRPQKLKVLPV